MAKDYLRLYENLLRQEMDQSRFNGAAVLEDEALQPVTGDEVTARVRRDNLGSDSRDLELPAFALVRRSAPLRSMAAMRWPARAR